jgi:hypothetical protein
MTPAVAQVVAAAAREATARPLHALAEWPEPREIPNGLPPVEPFAPELLPASVRPWIVDIAERIQCPPDYPAACAIVALASVVGRGFALRPGRRNDWSVHGILWGAIIGPPGALKSPAVNEVLKPLRRLEAEAEQRHAEAARLAEALATVRDVKRATTGKKEIEKQLKDGVSEEKIAEKLAEEAAAEPEPRRRYIVNDVTHEKLAVILATNPRGVLAYRDELTGWLRSLDKEGREEARAYWLETWTGQGRYEPDRIGRATVAVRNGATSVFGTIQPGPLRAYLRGAVAGGQGADGLVQRFQLAVWPDVAGEWRHVDRWPDTEAKRAAWEVFRRLADLSADDVGAERDEYDDEAAPFLRFGPAAYELFVEWRTDLERRIRADDEHPALIAHLAKYRSLVPTLALVSHLADGQTGDVGEAALVRALGWADYLETHARRLYASVTGSDTAPARALARRIRAGDVQDGFTARDVYRACWTALGTPDEVREAVADLVDLGWLREDEEQTGGRPKVLYRINPRARATT